MPPYSEACSSEGHSVQTHIRPRMLASDAGRTRLGERVRPAFFGPAIPVVSPFRKWTPLVLCRPLPGSAAMLPRPLILGLLAALLAVAGCAPSISPLYRDYEIEEPAASAASPREDSVSHVDVHARLRGALFDAGWILTEPTTPHVVSTEPREFGSWGLYRVLVSLDAILMGDRYVRVHFHPVRRYFTGARSKIPSLGKGIRSALLPDLIEAFEAQGLRPLGVPHERDENQASGT